jgi:hypothetical protein
MNYITNIYVNDVAVPFKSGVQIKSILSEELDIGRFVIAHTEKITIEPFDEIRIQFGLTPKYFLISSVQETISRYTGTMLYNYDINFVSPTIKLQRIVLPNRSITRNISSDTSLSIYAYLFRMKNIYAPELNFDSEFINKTSTIQCPEFTWNRPTFFEMFNDLLSTINCVVTMTDFETISLLDLTTKKNVIDETKISNYQTSQDGTEYASSIEIEAQNVYAKNSLTYNTEFVSIRTSSGIKITTDNQEIVLQKPIFTIEKATALLKFTLGTNILVEEIDITDRIVSKDVYELLTSSNQIGYIEDTPTTKYRRNYLFFSPGSNVIDGITFREDNWMPYNDTKQSICHVIRWALQNKFPTHTPISDFEDIADDLNGFLQEEIVFNIQYTTTDSIIFKTHKSIPTKHKSTLINNQTTTNVYSESLGKQQQEFVNRIGNKRLNINSKYLNINDLPGLNDFIDNFIMTEKEIVYFDSYILLNGYLDEYHSRKNMFAGINTEKRYTQIADPSKAFLSTHINEEFYEFDFVDKIGDDEKFSNYAISNYGKTNKKIDGAIVQTQFANSTYSDLFLLQGTPYHFGNSFVYSIKMEDNANVSYQLDETTFLIFSGVANKLSNYVDENGNFEKISIQLYQKDGIKNEAKNPSYINNFSASRNFLEITNQASIIPKIETNRKYWIDETTSVNYSTLDQTKKIYDSNFVNRYKDNREITSEVIQFNFLSNSNVIVNSQFIKYLPMLYNQISNASFKIVYSTNETYNLFDQNYIGNIIPQNELQPVFNGNSIYIDQIGGSHDLNVITSWAILDENDNLLIAINSDGNQNLYLNKI